MDALFGTIGALGLAALLIILAARAVDILALYWLLNGLSVLVLIFCLAVSLRPIVFSKPRGRSK